MTLKDPIYGNEGAPGLCNPTDEMMSVIEADRDRLLQRFERSQESTAHGLGLAIAYRLAAENAIAIAMSSAAGVGTCFRLRIP